MKKVGPFVLLMAFVASTAIASTGKYELATEIESSSGVVELNAQGYTKLNLLKFDLNKVGNIALKGAFSVDGGKANIVMWSKVQGRYYFTKLPALQGYYSRTYKSFSIPFSSKEHPVTEVLLNVELPEGGMIKLKNIHLE